MDHVKGFFENSRSIKLWWLIREVNPLVEDVARVLSSLLSIWESAVLKSLIQNQGSLEDEVVWCKASQN